LAVFSLSLWHTTHYWSSNARSAAGLTSILGAGRSAGTKSSTPAQIFLTIPLYLVIRVRLPRTSGAVFEVLVQVLMLVAQPIAAGGRYFAMRRAEIRLLRTLRTDRAPGNQLL
jgi:hypothetical protein